MYQEIFRLSIQTVKNIIQNNPQKVYYWLLDGWINGLGCDKMEMIWCTAGYTVRHMYGQLINWIEMALDWIDVY